MSDFTQVFRDDFNGSSLNTGIWKAQYAAQGWTGMYRWDPGQLQVGDGKLTIVTENTGNGWLSGGLATIPDGQTYGSYEFRARFDQAQGVSGAILLWPSDGQWTDEVDIVELHDPSNQSFAFVNHGPPTIVQYIPVNISDWHTYRLDWTPGELVLFVDGREMGRITEGVPAQDMSFGMQGQVMSARDTWFGGAPDWTTPSRVNIEVDWVKVSAWTPGRGDQAETWQAPAPAPAPAAAAAAVAEEWSGTGWSQEAVSAPVEASQGSEGGMRAPAFAMGPDYDWMAAAQRYIEWDGTWEGSWRNYVASGEMTIGDVADLLRDGWGCWSFWG